MEAKVQIGLVQAGFANGDVRRNLESMSRTAAATKERNPNVKLIVFPELAATGYFLTSDIRDYAEGPDDSIAACMAETARNNDVYIGYGYVESGRNGEIYNSLRLIDRHGRPLANYRKIHLTEFERGTFMPGDEIVSADTEWGRAGLAICWDLAFPELARTLALRGANLILSPCAWEKPYAEPLARFAMARAIDNTVYVAVCNHVERSVDFEFCGNSGLYGPDGCCIASAGEEEQVVVVEADFDRQAAVKSCFYTMLQERRPDLYGLKGEV